MDERGDARSWWPWVVGVLLLILLAWAVSGMLRPAAGDVKVEESAPAAG